jgi:alpha-ketoglutarate-dependent taurine dioxygenase
MIEVIPLSTHVGAEIRGVDFSREFDLATTDEPYAAWLKHLVLVIRG